MWWADALFGAGLVCLALAVFLVLRLFKEPS